MLFHIRHRLHYRYERPVFLEPMVLRLTPRQDASQRLLRRQLHLQEPPAGLSRVLEADGHAAEVVWFEHSRAALTIELELLVETLRTNPFDWIVTRSGARRLPVTYSEAERLSLGPCLGGEIAPVVRQWAAQLAAEVEGSSSAFLIHVADRIHHGFHHIGRLDGAPMTPEQTLSGRSGACRDTAMLYVAACRSQGLAARFVSGYSMHHPEEVTEHELHAWAEVYLSGGGWLPYDPSLGLAVADGHVALAAAPDHRLAAPVSGSYRGTGVGSTMEYAVSVRAAESLLKLEVNGIEVPN
jgi:transglutaminase-like putative cysteine protease